MIYVKEDIEQIRQLIADGESQKAIEAFLAIASDDARVEDDLVLLDSRLTHLQKAILEGTIARDDENIERNTINRNMLALLKILEQEPKAKKTKTRKVVAPKTQPPAPQIPAVAPIKTDFRSRLPWLIGGLLLLVLSIWGVGRWLFAPRSAPAIRDLTVRLVLRPNQVQLPNGIEARLQVGDYLSSLQPVPPNGIVHFEKSQVEHPTDSVDLQLSGLKYPGKIEKKSALNFSSTDSIAFFYKLELIELAGQVLYPNLKPAPNIELELDGGLARVVTDKAGKYRVEVPRMEKTSVEIVFRKNGKVVDRRTMGFIPELFKELKIQE